MVNVTLLWLLLIPVIMSAITYVIFPRLMPRVNAQDRIFFSAGGLIISAVILITGFLVSRGALMSDTEIWNGEITNKTRVHDYYTRSYQCMCVTDSKGNTVCQTCYEDRYTVKWTAHSNIGDFTIHALDEGSKSVYQEPDPSFYTQIRNGDPCSRTNGYKNYIKAVPESLFRPAPEHLRAIYQKWIPAYPLNIYDHYKINRVLSVGFAMPDQTAWNTLLSEKLKKLGPTHQANAVIVIAKTDDPNYFYALQDAWLGGKKNDIIIVIGAPNFPQKAEWVNIMALTDKEMFKVELRDAILDLPTLTPESVISAFDHHTRKSFKRKRMRDFQYLESEIDPPTWVVVSMICALFAAYVIFWFYMKNRNGRIFYRRRY